MLDLFDVFFDGGAVTLFLYIMARMSGFVQFNPLLGRQNISASFRGGFVLLLTVFVYFITDQDVAVPGTLLEFALRILLELLLGFLLGLVMDFFFYIPQLAGQMIDTQMGMTMNQIYDAGARANLTVNSLLLNTLMLLLFFAANGHHTLLRIMLTSGRIVEYGGVHILSDALVNGLLELFIECTVLAVKLCMPILAAELLGQLGMGILMKVIPQINVFSINIELKVIIGLGLLLALISPFSEYFLSLERTMLDRMSQVLMLTG